MRATGFSDEEQHAALPAAGVAPHGVWRLVGAVVCGALAGNFMSGAFLNAAEFRYPDESPDETWGLFFWGDHWFLRAVASLAATAWGGFLAGVVARRHGGLVAVLGAAPAAALWAVVFALSLGGGLVEDRLLSYRLLSIFLVLAIPVCAFVAGQAGSPIGGGVGAHFDRRRQSLLGIRWFHYFWIAPLLNVIVIQALWAVLYGAEWTRLWLANFSIARIFPFLFVLAIYGTLALTFTGLKRAYLILAGFANPDGHRAWGVLKFGVGVPVIAALLQSAILYIHQAIAR